MATNYLFDERGRIMGVIGSNDNDAVCMLKDGWVLYCPDSPGYCYFMNDTTEGNLGGLKPMVAEEIPEAVRMTILLMDL